MREKVYKGIVVQIYGRAPESFAVMHVLDSDCKCCGGDVIVFYLEWSDRVLLSPWSLLLGLIQDTTRFLLQQMFLVIISDYFF